VTQVVKSCSCQAWGPWFNPVPQLCIISNRLSTKLINFDKLETLSKKLPWSILIIYVLQYTNEVHIMEKYWHFLTTLQKPGN
jgi:hypothetical protein